MNTNDPFLHGQHGSIIESCRRFQNEWRNPNSPAPIIGEYLAKTPPNLREPLLKKLIDIEIEIRREMGEHPSMTEYKKRFGSVALESPNGVEQLPRTPRVTEDPTLLASLPDETISLDGTSPVNPVDVITRHSIGGYEIIEEIARGGMGVVFRAIQLDLKRIVAIKMILEGELADEKSVRRFKREAESAANLQHPNIVSVFEVGEQDGRHYFTMEYVEGPTLFQFARSRRLSTDIAADITMVLAEAAHFAHSQGILHRDLKPANVIMSASSDPPKPMITDFGLAKQLETGSQITGTGAMLGTPSYMAPEQAGGRARDIGPPTDVYALGTILYQLLTGKPPFIGETGFDILQRLQEEDPVAPRQIQPEVPRDLEAICLKCLEKKPDDRYPTAAALAADIERFSKSQQVHARAPNLWEKCLKAARRNPDVAAMAGTAAAAASDMVLILCWLGNRLDVAILLFIGVATCAAIFTGALKGFRDSGILASVNGAIYGNFFGIILGASLSSVYWLTANSIGLAPTIDAAEPNSPIRWSLYLLIGCALTGVCGAIAGRTAGIIGMNIAGKRSRGSVKLTFFLSESRTLGQSFEIVLTVENQSRRGKRVRLVVNLPDGLSHESGREIECYLRDFDAGEKQSVTLDVVPVEVGRHRVGVRVFDRKRICDAARINVEVE